MSTLISSAARTGRAARRPTNVSLDSALVDEARALGVNLSQACERGVIAQVAETRAARWRDENCDALASSNTHVDAHGLPLAGHRLF